MKHLPIKRLYISIYVLNNVFLDNFNIFLINATSNNKKRNTSKMNIPLHIGSDYYSIQTSLIHKIHIRVFFVFLTKKCVISNKLGPNLISLIFTILF